VNNGFFSREMANNGRIMPRQIRQSSLLVCFLINKYFIDSGGSISLDHLGVSVNVEHRMQ